MCKKTLYFFILVLTCSLGFATTDINSEPTIESAEAVCDCDELPNPIITYTSDPLTCEVTFTATMNSGCAAPSEYVWSVNNVGNYSTGTSNTFAYETLDNMASISVSVVFPSISLADDCEKTAFLWLEDITCEGSLGGIVLTKRAYNSAVSNVPLDTENGVLYETQYFEYRIEIRNQTGQTELMEFNDVFTMAGVYDVMCEFIMFDTFSPIINMGVPTGEVINHPSGLQIPPAQIINVLPGLTEIIFRMFTSDGTCLSHNKFENCASVSSVLPGGFESESCTKISLRYGCPVGMSDGFCLEPEDLEEGDLIYSYMTGHTSFFNIQKLTGRLYYDYEKVATPTMILDPIVINDGFSLTTDPVAPGAIDFEISSLDPLDTFNIGSGGTFSPLKVTAILSSDLVGCMEFIVGDVIITSGGTDQSIYVDPGKFCNSFPPGYEEAIIVIEEGASDCASILDPITLNVVGPFNSQHPNTDYLWSNGETTSSITVSEGGTYFVNINDQVNCDRYAEITVQDCAVACECGSVNPEIEVDIIGCSVDATVNMPPCDNLESIVYQWTFSNGNTHTGEFPPTQLFAGIYGGSANVTLKIVYQIDGVVCEEIVSKDIFVPCRGGGLKMYPNPANDNVQIDIEDDQINAGTIRVLNTQGMVVLEESFNLIGKSGPLTCDVKSLAMGLYFVQLIDGKGVVIDVKRLAIR